MYVCYSTVAPGSDRSGWSYTSVVERGGMGEQAAAVRLRQRQQFDTLTGGPLRVTVGEVQRADSGAVEGRFRLSYDAWQTALDRGCFHLDAVTERPGVDPGDDVELRVRLRDAATTHCPTDLEALDDRLGDPTDPLWHTAAWYATGVLHTVDVPEEFDDALGAAASASVGVETTWQSFFAPEEDRPDSVAAYVREYFDEDGWDYEVLERGAFAIDVSLPSGGSFSVYVYTDDDARSCSVYAVHPDTVPQSARDEVDRLLATRNYELETGAFGVNAASGEVRFRNCVSPDDEPFARAFDDAVAAMSSVFADVRDAIAAAGDGEVTDSVGGETETRDAETGEAATDDETGETVAASDPTGITIEPDTTTGEDLEVLAGDRTDGVEPDASTESRDDTTAETTTDTDTASDTATDTDTDSGADRDPLA